MKAIITIEDNPSGNVNVGIVTEGVGPDMPDTDASLLFAAVLETIKDSSDVVGQPEVKIGNQ